MTFKTIITYLSNFYSVSNQEEEFSKFIISKLKSHKHVFTTDKIGNLYFVFNENLSKKLHETEYRRICICAHIDEPGLLVSNINSNGTISFIKQGNFLMFSVINTRVKIKIEKKEYHGVIYRKQRALTSNFELNNTKNYFVDFGFLNKENAVSKFGIKPGQVISFSSDTKSIANNRVLSKNLNNRISVAVIIENLEKLIAQAKENKIILTIAFLVQKQIGNRGGFTVPANIFADLYINLDSFDSQETTSNTSETGINSFQIGSGPCIQIFDPSYLTKKSVQVFLENVADRSKIKYQYAFTNVPSNCGALSMATEGQIILPIGFAYRYSIGPSQIADLTDVNYYEKYLLSIIKNLTIPSIKQLTNIY